MRSPIGRALVAGGSTLFIAGAGTVVLSTVTMTAFKGVVNARQRKYAVGCQPCGSRGKLSCEVCRGKGVLDWSPFPDPVVQRMCLCPACDGEKDQKCMNCMGKGAIVP